MKAGWLALSVLAVALPASPAAAESPRPKSYVDGATRKLGRGVANILTSPGELARLPIVVTEEEGGLAGGSVGLAQGFRAMAWRGVVGAFEVATFYLPMPNDFAPIVYPEFIYANGSWTRD